MKRLCVLVAAIALVLSGGPSSASPIAFYNFNETSGNIAHDSVGSVNGTLMGNAHFDPGAGPGGGGAISFNKATNDYVTMGNNFGFTGGVSFSIQAWVKTAPGDTSGMTAVSKHHAGIAAGYFLAVNDVQDGTGGTNKAHFFAGYPTSGNSSTTVNDGLWHQLVGVYNATNDTISLYVDGQFQSSSSGASPIVGNDAPFLVGGVFNLAGDGTPTGRANAS